MPAVGTQGDRVATEIASLAKQHSQNAVLINPVLGSSNSVLADPSTEQDTTIRQMLQDLSAAFFGEPTKIIDRVLAQDWINRCGNEIQTSFTLAGKGKSLLAFVTDRVRSVRPSAIGQALTTADLATAFDRTRSAGCNTLAEMAACIAFADRLSMNFDHDQSIALRNKWLKTMATAANDDKIANLYDAANALNEIWIGSDKSLQDIVVERKSTISAERTQIAQHGEAARNLTEIARCASELRNRKPNVAIDNIGNLLITDPSEIGQVPGNAAAMARDIGEGFFGLPRKGPMVNTDVISRWIDRAPRNEIGTAGDIVVKAHNLMGYIDRAARSLHGVNTQDLRDVLNNAYRQMQSRKCDTVMQASDVLEYADSFNAYKKQFPKGRSDVLDLFESAMDGDPTLANTSQYRFVRELQRIEGANDFTGRGTVLSVLDKMAAKNATLEEVERVEKVGPGPEREAELGI